MLIENYKQIVFDKKYKFRQKHTCPDVDCFSNVFALGLEATCWQDSQWFCIILIWEVQKPIKRLQKPKFHVKIWFQRKRIPNKSGSRSRSKKHSGEIFNLEDGSLTAAWQFNSVEMFCMHVYISGGQKFSAKRAMWAHLAHMGPYGPMWVRAEPAEYGKHFWKFIFSCTTHFIRSGEAGVWQAGSTHGAV